MENQAKILISGYFGFGNLGDEAILSCLANELKKNLPQVKLIVLSGNPEQTTHLHQLEAVNRWHLSSIWKRLKSSDVLISGGGGLLQDVTSSRSLWYYLLVILMAWLRRVPFFIVGCGIGPIRGKINEMVTEFLLQKATYISVRDKGSYHKLKEWRIDQPHIHLGEDLAFGLESNAYNLPKDPNNQARREKLLAITLKEPSMDRVRFIDTMTAIIDQVIRKLGMKAVFLPTHPEKDSQISWAISKKMKGRSEIIDLSNVALPTLLNTIGRCRLLLGMRLHALEFACLAGTPFVAISYDPKIDEFIKKLGGSFPNYKEEDLGKDQVIKALANLDANFDYYQQILERKVRSLGESAHNSLKMVSDEISDLLKL